MSNLAIIFGILFLWGGCSTEAPTTPACRGQGEACTQTTDCCLQYVCEQSACVPPQSGPTCGDGKCDPTETMASCCADCGCPTGEACEAHACVATCGNGTCDNGETVATCCTDCGCDAAQVCRSNVCDTVPTSVMTWNFTNNCTDLVQIKLFDTTLHPLWEWPSHNTVWAGQPGTSGSQPITCITGDLLCYGAFDAVKSEFWGVDTGDTQTCSACCWTCAAETVTVPPFGC